MKHNLKMYLILTVIVITGLCASVTEAQAQTHFEININWVNTVNQEDEIVTMIITFRDELGIPVDQVGLNFEDHYETTVNVTSTWGRDYEPDGDAVTWEVDIAPVSFFDTFHLVDGDEVAVGEINVLDNEFVYGE